MKALLKLRTLAVAAGILGLSVMGASAMTYTVTIQNVGGSVTYGAITADPASSGDVLGYYNGGWDPNYAERFASGNNAYEESLVKLASGLASVSLGGTELAINGATATVSANTYFTAKFAQSLAIFHNTTDFDIEVTFDKSVCTSTVSNQCGEISHYKSISDGTSPVPLPAAGWVLIAGIGSLAALRRRRRA